MSVIESEGHRSWVPLDLDLTAVQTAEELRRRFEPADEDERFELNVAAATGTVASLREQAAALEASGTVVCAAWLLTREPTRLDVRAVAVLRASAVPVGTPLDALVEGVIGDEPRHGEPWVEELETWSGDAHRIRYRPLVRVDGDDEVHQVNVVLWSRPEDGVVFLLSCHVDSLLGAHQVGDLLDELAAGMKGL